MTILLNQLNVNWLRETTTWGGIKEVQKKYVEYHTTVVGTGYHTDQEYVNFRGCYNWGPVSGMCVKIITPTIVEETGFKIVSSSYEVPGKRVRVPGFLWDDYMNIPGGVYHSTSSVPHSTTKPKEILTAVLMYDFELALEEAMSRKDHEGRFVIDITRGALKKLKNTKGNYSLEK